MASNLCFTVRFLQQCSHGRGNDGEPEWPPSPLRLFQALTSAAAAKWNERLEVRHAAPALRWLEEQSPPTIVAGEVRRTSAPYRLYVPDNVGDLVAKSWSRGGNDDIASYRTEKVVHPLHLEVEAVHYLFRLAVECPHIGILQAAARSITHLGWGVDMVVGDAYILDDEEAGRLRGDRWTPAKSGRLRLRTPRLGTLDDLHSRHERFLHRLDGGNFQPVPPLRTFQSSRYRCESEPTSRPFAAFAILEIDASEFRPYDPIRRSATVAGMVRHALGGVARKFPPPSWSEADVAHRIFGHDKAGKGPVRNGDSESRLLYVPLPSLTPVGVSGIRRVLVVGPVGGEESIAWVRRSLSGIDLKDEDSDEPSALLSLIPNNDRSIWRYAGSSSVWTTVTPVLLPGYDDPSHLRRRLNKPGSIGSAEEKRRLLIKLEQRIDALLRKAIRQSGYSDILAENALLEWRQVGFLPGVARASDYTVPENLKRLPRWHVRIHWRDAKGDAVEVPGPIAIGGGRFRGFGIFAIASVDQS